jgi:hypothetical protein
MTEDLTPQVGEPITQHQAGTPPTPQAGDTPPTLSLENALAELSRVRKEAAQSRVRLNEFEEKARKDAEAQMTEAQKEKSRADSLERDLAEKTAAHQQRALMYEVQLHAAKLGIINPAAAIKLLDLSALEYEPDGTPKNAGKLLQDLVKAEPWIAGTPASGSAANPPRNDQSMTFTDAQIAAMSPEDYQKHKSAIFLARKEGRIIG